MRRGFLFSLLLLLFAVVVHLELRKHRPKFILRRIESGDYLRYFISRDFPQGRPYPVLPVGSIHYTVSPALEKDPETQGYGLVIFDEFHARSLHADTALALTLHTQHMVRAELRLLVMSATLDGAAVARLLGDAPVLSSQGRQYPVDTHYLPTPRRNDFGALVAATARRALRENTGDVLVFLPGAAEIRRAVRECEGVARRTGRLLLPLHGDLPPEEQDRAVRPADRPKIILSTNVAESSITIDGVTTVIDLDRSRGRRDRTTARLVRVELDTDGDDGSSLEQIVAGVTGLGSSRAQQ